LEPDRVFGYPDGILRNVLPMSDLTAPAPAIRTTRHQPLINISADRGWMQRFQLAAEDVREGAKLWRLAWVLGLADIKLRYRGSLLGPFWLTLSFAIMIGAMGFLYADLFHTDIHTYLPYLTVSLLFWNYLNTLVSEGCTCFSQVDSLIKGTRMPFTVHALRTIIRNTIVLAHNVVVVVAVFLILQVHVSLYALWAIPGLMLWLVDAFAIALLFGAFCARFRDVPQIIASVMQIAFFVTPIMWYGKILESHPRADLLIRFNPFFYLLEIIRAPLLGTPLPGVAVAKALIVSGGIIVVSALAFARVRGRIAYWV
jgi:homopolymeric O-antigen transport system permease protein